VLDRFWIPGPTDSLDEKPKSRAGIGSRESSFSAIGIRAPHGSGYSSLCPRLPPEDLS